jgi:hypothetical protein
VVDAVIGSVVIIDKSGATSSVNNGQPVYEGGTLNTGESSEVHVVTADGGLIALRSNTSFRVDEYRADGGATDKIFMSLFKGAARSVTGWIGKRNAANYRMTTPVATIGIRGTDHETVVINKPGSGVANEAGGGAAGTYDTVYEGGTVLKTQYGAVDVSPTKFVFAPQEQATSPVILASAPEFFLARKLLIEERIEPRKEFLKQHMDQLLQERIKQMQGGLENTPIPETENSLREKLKFSESEQNPAQKSMPVGTRNDAEDADNQSFSEAVHEYDNKNYEVAFAAFSRLAEQGNAEAQYLLAVMYGDGQGAQQDLVKALMWAKISVINGSKNKLSEMVAQLLPVDQISKAQDMAQRCLASDYKSCE